MPAIAPQVPAPQSVRAKATCFFGPLHLFEGPPASVCRFNGMHALKLAASSANSQA